MFNAQCLQSTLIDDFGFILLVVDVAVALVVVHAVGFVIYISIDTYQVVFIYSFIQLIAFRLKYGFSYILNDTHDRL